MRGPKKETPEILEVRSPAEPMTIDEFVHACRRTRKVLARRAGRAQRAMGEKSDERAAARYFRTLQELHAFVRLMEFCDALQQQNAQLQESLGVLVAAEDLASGVEIPVIEKKHFMN